MKIVTVVLPTTDELGSLDRTVVVKSVSGVGIPGPRGPGILSNITRITASTTPPLSPDVNDLWVDLS